MQRIDGTHARADGSSVAWQAEYEVAGNAIHFRARFGGGDSHEGQFDFDPAHLDPAEAVRAFMRDHIAKADRDVAP